MQVKKLTETAKIPVKAHPTDAGFDIFADETRIIHPGETVTISTGLAVAIPVGYYGRLKGRSGLTSKTTLRIQEGTIDSSYRGEIKVIADIKSMDYYTDFIDQSCGAMTSLPYNIIKGDRIAQLIIQPLPAITIEEVTELDETDRGTGGFGSTGR